MAIDHFGKRDEINRFIKEQNIKTQVAKKFNGRVVMEATGLEAGEQLGKFMAELRRNVFRHTDDSIIMMSELEIHEIIQLYFKSASKVRLQSNH